MRCVCEVCVRCVGGVWEVCGRCVGGVCVMHKKLCSRMSVCAMLVSGVSVCDMRVCWN